MKLTVIESPYKGDIKRNVAYALECMKDSLRRGESPFLSHLLYTMVLNDKIPHEQKIGIDAGSKWVGVADQHVFYIDLGWSDGMLQAKENTTHPIITRKIICPCCTSYTYSDGICTHCGWIDNQEEVF